VERRFATVLFVDRVDSTGLITGADPEVVRRRVQTFFDRVSHCVITHGGIVEKFAGDAVMAAFGIPQAHEDDAERAVRAGLGSRSSRPAWASSPTRSTRRSTAASGEHGGQTRAACEPGPKPPTESCFTFSMPSCARAAVRAIRINGVLVADRGRYQRALEAWVEVARARRPLPRQSARRLHALVETPFFVDSKSTSLVQLAELLAYS
jgi:hypothetical protein